METFPPMRQSELRDECDDVQLDASQSHCGHTGERGAQRQSGGRKHPKDVGNPIDNG